MEKKRISPKAAAVVLVAVVLVGIVFCWRQSVAYMEGAREDWARLYMNSVAGFNFDYDALPASLDAYNEWQAQLGCPPALTDPGLFPNIVPENNINILAGTQRSFGVIHVKDPDNPQARALFEELMPYYEQAFLWEEGTAPEECLERLRALSDPDVLAEIDELAQRVWDLHESIDAFSIFVVPSDSDLQLNP